MRSLHSITLASLLVVILLLSACGQAAPAPSPTGGVTTTPTQPASPRASPTPTATAPSGLTPKSGGTLRIIAGGTVTNLGYPPEMSGPARSTSVMNIERLMEADTEGRPRAGLATAWEVASDLKTITLTLRKGVKFHDGTDFNAVAAKWNMDRAAAAKQEGTEAWASVDVVDDFTVRIKLNRF